ncbi:ABC-F family ATP-binding cassette domain-containing protein [bacterium]|nr:ABC-F family ATP-binding cassette domain-containing protein [bacterium]
MIRLEDTSIIFQGRPLFSGINWQITERSRVGLVGVNGSGKSTILKILAGMQEVESGRVVQAKNFTIGYLPQELQGSSDRHVFEEALSGCGSAQGLQKRLDEVADAMQHCDSASDEYSELVLEFGRLQRLYEEADGFSADSKTARVLQGLGVPQEWWQRPMRQLSGGWQMRVHLSRLILSAPSLLLLDEPTNHLDVESIMWLSSFLRSSGGGLILISHDRYFLDENVNEVVEIWGGKLHFYAGNYSFYRSEKEKRLELLRNAFVNQQEEIERIQVFIDRFRYKASKARQVQSRINMLERMARIELPQDTAQIRLHIPDAPRSGRVVMETKNLGHHYSEKFVFQNLSFQLERGNKIALAGVNGAGKTTLLKILAGQMKPAEGNVEVGHNVYPAYYAQMVADQLNLQNTVLQEISRSATNEDETRLRTVLGSFLFSGDDVYKKISMLSGGEKSRVSLAKILLKPSNLLLLDEPTNHLDMQSKEILLRALQEYEGTILFISHDRYFMDQLSEKVLELKDGKLTEYLGTYSEYLAKVTSAEVLQEVETPAPEVVSTHKTKDQKKQEALSRQEQARWKKEFLQPIQDLELQIAKQETRLIELEQILADEKTYQDKNRYFDLIDEYQKLKSTIQESYASWEHLQDRLNQSKPQ